MHGEANLCLCAVNRCMPARGPGGCGQLVLPVRVPNRPWALLAMPPSSRSVRGKWDAKTSGGCPRNETWVNNPQYLLLPAAARAQDGDWRILRVRHRAQLTIIAERRLDELPVVQLQRNHRHPIFADDRRSAPDGLGFLWRLLPRHRRRRYRRRWV